MEKSVDEDVRFMRLCTEQMREQQKLASSHATARVRLAIQIRREWEQD